MSSPAPATTELTMQFMDVGQGDCIYIEFPDGTNMLVDFGSRKNKRSTQKDALAYFQGHTRFKDKGRTLNYLVLTHGDVDHYNNVKAFVDAVAPDIKNLMFGGLESDYDGLVAWLRGKCPSMKVLVPPSTGPYNVGAFGGAKVRVLGVNAPATIKMTDDAWRKNTSSMVLQVEFANRRVILSGDATTDTEKHILTTFKNAGQLASLQSGALKVGHHGSARTSIRPSWIQAIKPEWIFIPSDRSGTLGDGLDSTGYRLPQELAIDIIRGNTTLAVGQEHRYFSSYAKTDYTGYENPDPDAMADDGGLPLGPFASQADKAGHANTWLTVLTRETIFTTLTTLDVKLPDGTLADQGVQYGIRIRSDAFAEVLTT